MFSRVSIPCLQQNPSVAERLAELLYDIGRGLVEKKEYDSAIKWLTRGFDILSQPILEQCGQDVRELRFCIVHGLGA